MGLAGSLLMFCLHTRNSFPFRDGLVALPRDTPEQRNHVARADNHGAAGTTAVDPRPWDRQTTGARRGELRAVLLTGGWERPGSSRSRRGITGR